MSKKEKITDLVNVALLEALAKNARTPVKELAIMVGKSTRQPMSAFKSLKPWGLFKVTTPGFRIGPLVNH